MNRPENDVELDAWLRRSSTLHEQLARLDRSEPSEELDRMVLERAREAIHTPPADRPIRQVRWTMPVALAATLVLAFTILIRVLPESESSLPGVAPETTAYESDAMRREEAPAGVRADSELPVGDAAQPQARIPSQASPPPASAELKAAASPALERSQKRDTLAANGAAPSVAQDSANAASPGVLPPEVHRDADRWLAAIAQLRAQGYEHEADRELALFRNAFPGHAAEPGTAAASATAAAPER